MLLSQIFCRCIRRLAIAISCVIFAVQVPIASSVAQPVPGFTNELVLSGLNQPVDIDYLPDGRMLVLLKPGEITISDPQANPPVASTYMTLTDIDSDGERGLIAITLDPDFAVNNYFYLYYAKASRSRFRVSRFTHQGLTADPGSEFLVWENPQPIVSCCHYGGGLDFGPDGAIYLTTGDVFDGLNAQDLTRADGKILRFNKDGSIPADNPFADGPGGNVDELWAIGLRNPFRATWDLPGGRFYIGVVGGNVQGSAMEDVKIGRAGANYGWPFCEGAFCSNFPEYDNPFFTYSHSGFGASITGGFVYRGTNFPPGMQGAYFFGDFVRQWIRYLTFDAQGDFSGVFDLDTTAGAVVALKEGPDGALYYADIMTGSIRRIVNLLATAQPVITLAVADDVAGLAPHTVNFSGAATDPDSPLLEFTWFFGDGEQMTGANAAHVYTVNGSYTARLSVSDGLHTVFSDDIVMTVGVPPTVSVDSPTDGSLFRAGDIITYAGSGNDADGLLDASSLGWDIEFLHNEHTHPGQSGIIGNGGTFHVDSSGHDFSDNTGFHFTLTVTDMDGLTASQTVTVFPDKVNVTFTTTPPVNSILLDGVSRVTPFVHDTLIDFNHAVSVPAETCINGTRYVFESWSDAGAATHVFTVPNAPVNLNVIFSDAGPCPRVTAGLQVLYDFSTGFGAVVQDRSGNVPALDLTIANLLAVTWMPNGGLSVDAPTVLATSGPATRLRDALQATGEVTMEAWVQSGDLSGLNFGPARIIGFSQDGFPVGGNLIMGQSFGNTSEYTIRMRTSSSNQYGSPELLSPPNSATSLLRHVVYTRSSTGLERIYLNGAEVSQGSRAGALTNWGDYVLALANEPDEGRPWLGELRLVAIYDRVLGITEVSKNFSAGPFAGPPPAPSAPKIDSPPASTTVVEGQPASFSVLASGTAPLSYQWERDFVALPGETQATLLLAAVTLPDDGAGFRCVVTNAVGSVTSLEAMLTVTPLPPGVSVPDVTGQTRALAETTLGTAGLTLGTVSLQNSEVLPVAAVISQNPVANTLVALGFAVDLVVSSGPAPVNVPDVVGQMQGVAETTLAAAGLTLGAVSLQNSALMPVGDVISQNPAAGASVLPATAVDLVVSSGPVAGNLRINTIPWLEKPTVEPAINQQFSGMAPMPESAKPTYRVPLIDHDQLIDDNPFDLVPNLGSGQLLPAPDGEMALHVNTGQGFSFPQWDGARSPSLSNQEWTIFLDVDIIATVGSYPALIAKRAGTATGYWQLNRVADGPGVNFAWNTSGTFRTVFFANGWPGLGRHQIVLTRDRGNYVYYVDGEQRGQAFDLNPVPDGIGAHDLTLGVLQHDFSATNRLEARYHNVWINIYHAISSTDVATLAVNPWQIYAQTNLPGGIVGVVYPGQVLTSSGGVAPYTWSIVNGSLPPGLTLSSDGIISGKPEGAGPAIFTVQVMDATTASAMLNLEITVAVSAGYICSACH